MPPSRDTRSDSQPISTCSTIEPKYTADRVAAASRSVRPLRTPQIGSSVISADSYRPNTAMAPRISGARANMVSGPAPRSRPKPRETSPAPNSGSVASAVIAALTRNGGHPSMPVSDRISGPVPNPADSAAA